MAASQKQIPFTTKENNPRVRMLRGKDKTDKTGLTDELTKPTAIAAKMAAGNVAISTPGTARSTTSRLNAVAKMVRKKLSIVCSYVKRVGIKAKT